jgi:hypothetical protein
MPYGEIISRGSEMETKHGNNLWRRNVEIWVLNVVLHEVTTGP